MSIVSFIYDPVNGFLLNHIPEIAFVLLSLIYIFFWKYVFLFFERIFRGISYSFFENRPTLMNILGYVDSFFIFMVTVIFAIPLMKKLLEGHIEPLLDTKYLLIVVLVLFALSYLYYYLVYSRHYLHPKN